jgi:PAS domain S-box-containing protein
MGPHFSCRILLVEDNAGDALLLQEVLSGARCGSFHFRRSDCLAAALREVDRGEIDLVLLDLGLPDGQGLDTFVRMHAAAERLPIIVLSGQDDEVLANAAVQKGAQDYIVKGQVDGASLARAIRYALERCRVQQALADGHDHLRSVIDNLPDQVYLKDRDSRFVSVNPVTARFFGAATPDEVIGKSDFDYFPHALAAQFFAEEQALLQCGQACVNRETAVTDFTGNTRWVLTTKVPLRDQAGNVRGIVGINRDITERKQAERRQALATEVLSILNESSALESAISRVLSAIQQATGFDAAGIRLRRGDDYPYFDNYGFSGDFLRTENTLTVRTEAGDVCRDLNGNICLECTCGLVLSGQTDPRNPLFTAGGSCWTNDSLPLLDLPVAQDPRLHPRNRCIHEGFRSVALIPIRTDHQITGLLQLNDRRKDRFTSETILFFEGLGASIGIALARQLAEEKLAQHREHLEELVGTRTAELKGANERLLAHDKARAEFVSNVSHELKTPLASMKYGIGNLLTGVVGPLPERATEYLRMLDADCRRMASTVEDILDLGRLESKMMRLHRARCPFDRIIRRAATALMVQAQFKRINMVLSVSRGLGFVACDAFKMERAIVNLIGNAIKFTADGGRVEIRLCRETAAPDVLVVEVTDDGIGIAPQHLGRVAEKYFRVSDLVGGTGLGMAIAKEIIELHGGRMTVRSPPPGRERGTRVSVSLPVAEDPPILIISADAAVSTLLAEQLRAHGYQVGVSANIAGALTRARQVPPAVVVLDISAAGMSAPDLVHRMQTDQSLGAIPSVAVASGSAGPGKQAMLNGLRTPVLSAPWCEEDLLDFIETALRAGGHRDHK